MSSARSTIGLLALTAMASLTGCSSRPRRPHHRAARYRCRRVAQAEPACASALPAPADAAAEHVHSAPTAAAEKEWLQPPPSRTRTFRRCRRRPLPPRGRWRSCGRVYVFAAKPSRGAEPHPVFLRMRARGHKGNEDCFVGPRRRATSTSGKPTACPGIASTSEMRAM